LIWERNGKFSVMLSSLSDGRVIQFDLYSSCLLYIINNRNRADILVAAGATVVKDPTKVKLDMVIVDSLSLPPHVTAVPATVAKILRNVNNSNTRTTPVIDLSWATQCIIQRSRISMDHERYRPKIGSIGRDKIVQLFSIKVKSADSMVRYEVGDPVIFGKKHLNTSIGRIMGISHDRTTKKNCVEIKVLELHNESELMEGGQNASVVNIDDIDLQAPVVMLGGRHFNDVKESWKETIYIQKKPPSKNTKQLINST